MTIPGAVVVAFGFMTDSWFMLSFVKMPQPITPPTLSIFINIFDSHKTHITARVCLKIVCLQENEMRQQYLNCFILAEYTFFMKSYMRCESHFLQFHHYIHYTSPFSPDVAKWKYYLPTREFECTRSTGA